MARSRSSVYQRPDHFTREAKKAGYPARSVFKLEEIDARVRLLRPGMRVLDLGAAPGSWSLYAAKQIGPNGRLFAVDLSPLGTSLPASCTFLQGDALSLEEGAISALAPYDVVLSDMAPKTSGQKSVDQARSYELFMREELRHARARMKELFAEERLIRPEGTRSVSTELFVVGLGRKSVG
jgi:23S rRNA (uridine2552-2'-O)-methyltransferase